MRSAATGLTPSAIELRPVGCIPRGLTSLILAHEGYGRVVRLRSTGVRGAKTRALQSLLDNFRVKAQPVSLPVDCLNESCAVADGLQIFQRKDQKIEAIAVEPTLNLSKSIRA